MACPREILPFAFCNLWQPCDYRLYIANWVGSGLHTCTTHGCVDLSSAYFLQTSVAVCSNLVLKSLQMLDFWGMTYLIQQVTEYYNVLNTAVKLHSCILFRRSWVHLLVQRLVFWPEVLFGFHPSLSAVPNIPQIIPRLLYPALFSVHYSLNFLLLYALYSLAFDNIKSTESGIDTMFY